jgi:hypothetical protein
MRRLSPVLSSLFLAAPALAHEGHGRSEGGSLLHYLSEPLHAAAVVGAVLAAIFVARALRAARASRRG